MKNPRALIAAAGGAMLLTSLVWAPTPVGAAALTADSTVPDGDAGSLRDVIVNQATDPAGDTVTLDAGATYLLDLCTGTLQHGDTPLVIEGNGATIELPCPEQWVFRHGTGDLVIRDLTLQHTAPDPLAGGLRTVGAAELSDVRIEGVFNDGVQASSLTISDSSIVGAPADADGISVDEVTADGLEVTAFGDALDATTADLTDTHIHGNDEGGINATEAFIVQSTVEENLYGVNIVSGTIIDSTIANNDSSPVPVIEGVGVQAQRELTIVNSTITGNIGGTEGGGIYADGPTNLVHTTITDNTAPAGANVFIGENGSLESFGSVIAEPDGADSCNQPFDSSTHDVEGDGDSCGTDEADVTDLGLGALANNGGPTATRLPGTGSPLVDAIPTDSCALSDPPVLSDQRGTSRPQGSGCDVGAVEIAAVVTPPAQRPAPSTTTAPAARPTRAAPSFTG